MSALCFSGNGNHLVTGGADKVVKVWSIRQPQETVEHSFTLTGSSASIMSVQFDHLVSQLRRGGEGGGEGEWRGEGEGRGRGGGE